jgi:hypothetical protein
MALKRVGKVIIGIYLQKTFVQSKTPNENPIPQIALVALLKGGCI